MKLTSLVFALAAALPSVAAYGTVVNPDGPFPYHTESGQYGWNNCSSKATSSSKCQTLHINSLQDFCLYAPPKKATIGDSERYQVAYCTKDGHGSRLIPKGALKGAHFIRTPHYIQITGKGDFTKMHIPKGDEGGELDPHGADGLGNPIGALVIANINGKNQQITEWTQFISYNQFCIRACFGSDAAKWCNHIYDVMGCEWNEPGNYNSGFDTCKANDVAMPMGEYLKGSTTSTWKQGVKPTPGGQKAAKSSKCKKYSTVGTASYKTSSTKAARRHKRAAVFGAGH